MKKILCFVLSLFLLFSSTVFLFETTVSATDSVYADTSYPSPIMARGGTPYTTIQERIDYAYKVEDNYFIPSKVPAYLSNYTCGITAGGAAIGYYDRSYEDLIPNHTGSYFLGKWGWGTQGAEVNKVCDYLYTAMGATPQGVTMNGYLTGVQSYVSSRGRTAAFTSVKSGNQLNAAQYKAAIQSGKLLTIFVQGFTINDFGEFLQYPNYDYMTTYINSGNHIMVAYGYYDVSYYNSSNQCFRRDVYLYVNSGYSIPTLCLTRISQYCIVDDLYITDIY